MTNFNNVLHSSSVTETHKLQKTWSLETKTFELNNSFIHILISWTQRLGNINQDQNSRTSAVHSFCFLRPCPPSVETSIQELQQFIPFVFCGLVLLCFLKFQQNLQHRKKRIFLFICRQRNKNTNARKNLLEITFLPETALRRTPSSLSCPKNCMNKHNY